MISVGQSAKIQKNRLACSCENVEHLGSTVNNSVIMSDEIVNDPDSLSTNVSCTMSVNADKKILMMKNQDIKCIAAFFTGFSQWSYNYL